MFPEIARSASETTGSTSASKSRRSPTLWSCLASNRIAVEDIALRGLPLESKAEYCTNNCQKAWWQYSGQFKAGGTRFQVWLPWADPSEPGEELDNAVTLQGPEGNGVTPTPSPDT